MEGSAQGGREGSTKRGTLTKYHVDRWELQRHHRGDPNTPISNYTTTRKHQQCPTMSNAQEISKYGILQKVFSNSSTCSARCKSSYRMVHQSDVSSVGILQCRACR